MKQIFTLRPELIPNAASKQAPEIRPCSRSSGLGASPNLPSGSDPMTLKYLVMGNWELITISQFHYQSISGRATNLRIMTDMSVFFE